MAFPAGRPDEGKRSKGDGNKLPAFRTAFGASSMTKTGDGVIHFALYTDKQKAMHNRRSGNLLDHISHF